MGQWTRHHPAVFILTFCSYALFHAVRKTLSFVKSSITEEWTPLDDNNTILQADVRWTRPSMFQDLDSAEKFLGMLNAIFLFAYAVGLYLSGMVADRLDLRYFLSAGMAASAVVIFMFGPGLEWSGKTSREAYICLMVLNGLLQATGWPCVLGVMGNWFGRRSRGVVLGVWSASPSLGSIIGALLASSVVGYGYEYAFLSTASVLFCGSIVIFLGLVVSPREVGLPLGDEYVYDDNHEDASDKNKPTVSCRVDKPTQQNGWTGKSVVNKLPLTWPRQRNVVDPCDSGLKGCWPELELEERWPVLKGLHYNSYAASAQCQKPCQQHETNDTIRNITETSRRKTSGERQGCDDDKDTMSEKTEPGNQTHGGSSFVSSHKLVRVTRSWHLGCGNSLRNKISADRRIVLQCRSCLCSRNNDLSGKESSSCDCHCNHKLDSELTRDNKGFDMSEENAQKAVDHHMKAEKPKDRAEESDKVANNTVLDIDSVVTPTESKASSNITRSEQCPGTSEAETCTPNSGDQKQPDTVHTECSSSIPDKESRPKAIGFLRALLLPGVIPYSLAFAFLKLVTYVFFFWLPFYLASSYGWAESTADQLAIWYDIGGVVGATVAGLLGYKFNKPGLVLSPMLLLAVPLLYMYSSLSAAQHITVNAIMLTCLGYLIGGVANIISSAISADLGRQDAIRGNVEALSTVAGIIEGTGTLGAALGQLAVPYLNTNYGWKSVFYLLMVAIFLTIVNILPIVVAELKDVIKRKDLDDE